MNELLDSYNFFNELDEWLELVSLDGDGDSDQSAQRRQRQQELEVSLRQSPFIQSEGGATSVVDNEVEAVVVITEDFIGHVNVYLPGGTRINHPEEVGDE